MIFLFIYVLTVFLLGLVLLHALRLSPLQELLVFSGLIVAQVAWMVYRGHSVEEIAGVVAFFGVALFVVWFVRRSR